MFAVKGWSVDASSLKPQTEIVKSSKQGHDGSGKSKKRKRSHPLEAKQDPNIRADDVGRLWVQHVEGGGLSQNQKKRERKKQKVEKAGEEDTGVHVPNATNESQDEKHPDQEGDSVIDGRAENLKVSKKDRKKVEKKAEKKLAKEKTVVGASHATSIVPGPTEKLTPMQAAMRQKLVSSRFRYLNQTLYTEPSVKAQQLFDQDPAMFEDYHAGFRQQVSVWPENPLDKFIIEIRRRAKLKPPKAQVKRKANSSVKTQPRDALYQLLPRTDGRTTIADLGCGDARLAQTLTKNDEAKSLRLEIKSFDLYSPSPYVTKADISNVPLGDQSTDIAILCLALMGTNWISFVEEAHRILRWKGELWIAEIKSRFGRINKKGKPVAHSVGNKKKQIAVQKVRDAKQKEEEAINEQDVLQMEVDGVESNDQETDVSAFVAVLKRRGFILKPPGDRAVDLKNLMFVRMEFVKALTPTKGKGVPKEQPKTGMKPPKTKFLPDDEEPSTEDEATVLKPCLYKIR